MKTEMQELKAAGNAAGQRAGTGRMPSHSQTPLQQVSAGQPKEQEAEGTTAGPVAQGDNWVPQNLLDGHPARVERRAAQRWAAVALKGGTHMQGGLQAIGVKLHPMESNWRYFSAEG